MELRDVEGYIADNLYKALTLIMSAGFFIGLHEGYATNNGAEITVAYIFGVLALIGGYCWIYDLRRSPVS